MFEKLLSHVDDILHAVTLKRVLLTLLLSFGLLMVYAMYENRQRIYSGILNDPVIGDYKLEHPTNRGKQALDDFVRRDKNIMLLTLIDADPLNNLRIPVYRSYGSEEVKRLIESSGDSRAAGSGPLFNTDPKNNEQILALMNGEMTCSPVNEGMFARMFDGVDRLVKYSCRVPLPPAFKKATGWFSIHLREMPEDMAKFKYEALNMSSLYYNMEIEPKADK